MNAQDNDDQRHGGETEGETGGNLEVVHGGASSAMDSYRRRAQILKVTKSRKSLGARLFCRRPPLQVCGPSQSYDCGLQVVVHVLVTTKCHWSASSALLTALDVEHQQRWAGTTSSASPVPTKANAEALDHLAAPMRSRSGNPSSLGAQRSAFGASRLRRSSSRRPASSAMSGSPRRWIVRSASSAEMLPVTDA